jgi:hypothetical protein
MTSINGVRSFPFPSFSFADQEEETTMRRIDSSFDSHDDLTELCFLLDEERKQMSELAEQWKAFGTHAICTLTSQLADYQKKLSELEQRQVSLFEENHVLSQQTRRSANRQVKTCTVARHFNECFDLCIVPIFNKSICY